jgi:molybdopterin/thiamine biosynthesis adenylyltransferase
MIDFTEEQLERYSRHILLDDVGVDGQEKLLQAKVLIVGWQSRCSLSGRCRSWHDRHS